MAPRRHRNDRLHKADLHGRTRGLANDRLEPDGAPFRLLCRREFHHCELDKGIHHLHPEIRVPIRPSMTESTDSLMNDKGYDLNRSHLCGRATDNAFHHRTQRRAYRGCFFVMATTK